MAKADFHPLTDAHQLLFLDHLVTALGTGGGGGGVGGWGGRDGGMARAATLDDNPHHVQSVVRSMGKALATQGLPRGSIWPICRSIRPTESVPINGLIQVGLGRPAARHWPRANNGSFWSWLVRANKTTSPKRAA